MDFALAQDLRQAKEKSRKLRLTRWRRGRQSAADKREAAVSPKEDTPLGEAKLEETDEVVVSASKTRQPVSHVTSAVEVITGEQMQKRNLKTVAEALRLATGMAVFSSGGQGTLRP